jgi:CheY-like chemotaxis protein
MPHSRAIDETILVVDDDPMVRELLADLVESSATCTPHPEG